LEKYVAKPVNLPGDEKTVPLDKCFILVLETSMDGSIGI
jgi:hypothetical protein